MTASGVTASLRLVVILDAAAAGGPLHLNAFAAAAVAGGATMLQLRDKQSSPAVMAETARRIMSIAGRVPLMINDRLDIALATGAAGCHLGQDDFPIDEARAIVPAGFILGGSAGTEDEARAATKAGAHYLGVGPVKTTANKADAGAAIGIEGFARIRAATHLPCIAIGGITRFDVPALKAAGATGIAVISAVLGHADPGMATQLLAEALKR